MFLKDSHFYSLFYKVFVGMPTEKSDYDLSDNYEAVLYDFFLINSATTQQEYNSRVDAFFADINNLKADTKHDEADYNFLMGWAGIKAEIKGNDVESRFKLVEKVDPKNPFTYTYLSNFYRKSNPELSFAYAKKAYEIFPECHIMINDYGVALTLVDNEWSNPDLGIELLQKASEAGNPYALYNIANYYAHIGDYLNNVRYHGMSYEKTKDKDSLRLYFNTISDVLLDHIEIKPKDQVGKISELIQIGANYDYDLAEFVYGRMLVKMSGVGEQHVGSFFIINDPLFQAGTTLIIDAYKSGLTLARNYLLNILGIDEEDYKKYDYSNPYEHEDDCIRPSRVFKASPKSCFDLKW